ncbi:hypothetical protein ILUMI_09718 [Ignelater luminosus]|uniref:Zinc carboxypeptidase A 1 n=1 Tax=Ignelater luminosus TaxID=2038154 RepID=A0A8K0CZ75_IGNLU|nr:hypothetical protein ILUMI_09718 [Ignelater luminosus]
MIVPTVITIFLLAVTFAEEFNDYDGYKVFRVQPSEEHHLKTLINILDNEDLDFWSPLRHDKHPVDVNVNPRGQSWFVNLLKNNSIDYEVLIDDVEKTVLEERSNQLSGLRSTKGEITFKKYHSHDEINAYLDKLEKNYPKLVSLETIGKSYEGRSLKLIKISTDSSAGKPVIFMDAGIHAREWIAPPVALYAIKELVENEANIHLLDKVDWHILPVVNPDGYEFSRTNTLNRFWRKTRSQGQTCKGVDANRNFDFHWAETGSSSRECLETYHGPRPFSELETQAVKEYILRIKDRVKLYLTLHSYGKMILYPWGYKYELPEDHEELQVLGDAVAESIRRVAGTKYAVGSVTSILLPGAGGSDDWAKGGAGIKFSYTVELPGGGSKGFDPPPTKITPVVTETWEGLKTFNDYIAKKYSN